VFFITPDANGIHGEPEITGFPIFDREFTLVFGAGMGAELELGTGGRAGREKLGESRLRLERSSLPLPIGN
jgi:hypothetical protein